MGSAGETGRADTWRASGRNVWRNVATRSRWITSRKTREMVSSALLEGRVAADNAVLGPRRRLVQEIVPTGSFTDPEYASVGLTEEQARARYDCAVAVARYEDLLRPVADGQPEGFCKLIVETGRRQIVGAHVLGEYSAEVIQMVAACMAAGMRIEEVAEPSTPSRRLPRASATPLSCWCATSESAPCPSSGAVSARRLPRSRQSPSPTTWDPGGRPQPAGRSHPCRSGTRARRRARRDAPRHSSPR